MLTEKPIDLNILETRALMGALRKEIRQFEADRQAASFGELIQKRTNLITKLSVLENQLDGEGFEVVRVEKGKTKNGK